MTADLLVPDTEPEEQCRPPATAHSIWTFLAFDCTSFGILFLAFMLQRSARPALFDESSRSLDPRLGLLNTCILITSSWLVASANCAGRNGLAMEMRRRLIWASAIASGFGVIKIAEYAQKVRTGIGITTNEFFTFYFALTAVHLFHYLIGMVVLVVLVRNAGQMSGAGSEQARYLSWLDGGALFWHLVDLLWIFLFCMLYLLAGL